MKFTTEELESFKKIYREEFGEEISNTEAIRIATKLINLFRVIYKQDSC